MRNCPKPGRGFSGPFPEWVGWLSYDIAEASASQLFPRDDKGERRGGRFEGGLGPGLGFWNLEQEEAAGEYSGAWRQAVFVKLQSFNCGKHSKAFTLIT